MNWEGLFYATDPEVYVPSDDSVLLAKAVVAEVRPGDRFLEVGCGTGLVSLAAARAGAVVTATDANPKAVALARHNAKENRFQLRVVETDLLAGLDGPFDVVAFNPPYLPTNPDEKVPGLLNLAFDGGLDGNEVVLRFADQVRALRPAPRAVLVVHSTLSDPVALDDSLRRAGFTLSVVAQAALTCERLTVRCYRGPTP